MHRIHHRTPAALFDPGWLFLLAGLALLGATAWISASNDTAEARITRDRLLAQEAHRQERISRYEEFMGAIEQKQPALIESLAAAQLNQIPADRAAIPGTVRDNQVDASVFPALEPPPLHLPERRSIDSRLARLVSGDLTRMLLLGGSALMILIGLLPPSRGWGKSQNALHPLEHNHSLPRASVEVEAKPMAPTVVVAGATPSTVESA
ncbi:MAG: hypothetical protein U0637_15315 [Phycisphaerales bacterium]